VQCALDSSAESSRGRYSGASSRHSRREGKAGLRPSTQARRRTEFPGASAAIRAAAAREVERELEHVRLGPVSAFRQRPREARRETYQAARAAAAGAEERGSAQSRSASAGPDLESASPEAWGRRRSSNPQAARSVQIVSRGAPVQQGFRSSEVVGISTDSAARATHGILRSQRPATDSR